MSVTVFCSFARRDLADFAVGRLVQEVTGIHCVKPVKPRGGAIPSQRPGVTLAAWGTAESWVVDSVSDSMGPGYSPVTIKVICDASSSERVLSLLRGMRGRIVGED